MTRSQAAEKVNALVHAWNSRDLSQFVALLSPDVTWHDLGMPHPPAIGRAAVREFSESLLRAFPDLRYEVRAPICVADDGGSCCVPWRISATHSAMLDPPGFAPTNRRVQFEGLDYLVFQGDGLISSIETRFDPAEAASQLLGFDVRPKAGSRVERAAVFAQRVAAHFIRRAERVVTGGAQKLGTT